MNKSLRSKQEDRAEVLAVEIDKAKLGNPEENANIATEQGMGEILMTKQGKICARLMGKYC